MKSKLHFVWLTALPLTLVANIVVAANGQPANPCNAVVDACKEAGFKPGARDSGKGLWNNCVKPIIQHKPSTAATLPLPNIPDATINECVKTHPNYGS